jgi:hypothetical protein
MNEMEADTTSDKIAPPGLRLHRVLRWTQSLAASGLTRTLNLKEPESWHKETLKMAVYPKTDTSFSSKADGDHVRAQEGHHLMQTSKNQKGFHHGENSLKELRGLQLLPFACFA